MTKGKRLEKGVGIVVSSSPLSEQRTQLGFDSIKSLGFEPIYDLSPYEYYGNYLHGFSNGSVEERLGSFKHALNSKTADVLLASRGGTGALELLKDFPIDSFRNEGKLLIGQSDVTVLLLQCVERAGVPAIFGPTLGADFADYHSKSEAKDSVDELVRVLTDEKYRVRLSGDSLGGSENAEGVLIGGNLSMLVSILGTPYDVSYDERILIIEEVGESPYKIDRMLNHLLIANKLNRVQGICFGRFAKCESKNGPSVDEVIKSFAKKFACFNSKPVISSLSFGHWGKSTPIPLGVKAAISSGSLETLDSPIS